MPYSCYDFSIHILYTHTKREREEVNNMIYHLANRSVGKESTCNAGDPSSIPGSGRSPGEGIGYPLQYSWVSLVAQLVKNPTAMQETWIRSLGQEDSPGEWKGYPLQYSGQENSMDHEVEKSRT